MIFETHAHYDDAKFDTDREMLLAELPQRGISPVINVGSSIATTRQHFRWRRNTLFFMLRWAYIPVTWMI